MALDRGGATIVEVLRRAWGRLIHKQSLIFYPLALAVIDTLAFFAVYAANGEPIQWDSFFLADFDRWGYIHDHFISDLSFTPALAVAVFVGLAVCAFAAMIRAPYFRAIAGPGYPLAPRQRDEAARLFTFYVFSNLVVWVVPLALPANTFLQQVIAFAVLAVAIIIVFADYAIVFETLSFAAAIRRSARLLAHRWLAVLVIFVVLQLVYAGIFRLYDLYYQKASGVFILLPLSRILVEAFIILVSDLVLIHLYEQIRRQGPA